MNYRRLDPAQLDNVPGELRQLPAWLHWKSLPNDDGKKPKKMPLYVNGKARKGTLDTPEDRAKLVTMDRALATFHDDLDGLGVALGRVPTMDQPLSGIDLDNCRKESGELAPTVNDVLKAAGDAYVEVSPSGTGIKLFGLGDIGKEDKAGLEIYSGGRFFTVTGWHIQGAHLVDLSEPAAVARRLLAQHAARSHADGGDVVENRNISLFWMTVGLRDQGMSEAEAWAALGEFNANHCKPPLAERELRQILRSAFKFSKEPVPVRPGELHLAVDRSVDALAKHADRLQVYVRGAALVRPYTAHRDGFASHDGAPTSVQSLELTRIPAAALRADLMRVVQFRRPIKGPKGNESAVMDCPRDIVAALIESPDQWTGLRCIQRVAQVPLFDGRRLYAVPGLHQGTWIDAPAGVALPKHLSRKSAVAALARVREYLGEFPFATDLDRAAAVALLLTAALRPSLAVAPACCISKPVFGAGATTLAKLAGVVATGHLPPVVNANRGEAETDKLIGAELMRGSCVLVFDNLREGEPMRSTLLAQALSDRTATVRELGKSVVHDVDAGALVILTGVNVSVADDLVRRTFHVHLDPRCEQPEAKEFKRPGLLQDAQRERVAMLSDLFSITAACLQAGELVPSLALAGFEHWVRWVAQPLVWLGLPDVVESVRQAAGSDPVTEQLRALLPLVDQLKRRPEHARKAGVTVADLLMPIAELNDGGGRRPAHDEAWSELRRRIHTVLGEATGAREFQGQPQLNPRVVGKWLGRVAGRVVGGQRIVRAGESNLGQRWAVENMEATP